MLQFYVEITILNFIFLGTQNPTSPKQFNDLNFQNAVTPKIIIFYIGYDHLKFLEHPI